MTVTGAQSDGRSTADDAAGKTTVVTARQLSLELGNRLILQDICMDVPPGQFVALLGANGAGKSTLLKVLATLMRPSRGSLHLFGQTVASETTKIRSRIGIIAHQPILYRDLSARENLEFFGKLYDLNEPAARAAQFLELVGLEGRAGDPVKTLSRGMTQRVALARALLHSPDLLLADEPFDGLDAHSARTLEGLLGRLHAEGKTVIMADHNIPRGLDLAQRAIVLRQGRIALDSPAGQLDVDAVLGKMG